MQRLNSCLFSKTENVNTHYTFNLTQAVCIGVTYMICSWNLTRVSPKIQHATICDTVASLRCEIIALGIAAGNVLTECAGKRRFACIFERQTSLSTGVTSLQVASVMEGLSDMMRLDWIKKCHWQGYTNLPLRKMIAVFIGVMKYSIQHSSFILRYIF